jgi:flavin-dependent dehydrogenase
VIDLIVAGGGPVGLVTAMTASMAGLEAVIVEPRTGIVDKACGEGLMPQALARLYTLGIDPDGVDLTGIRYLSGSRVARAQFSAGPGRGVRRTVLHEAMLGRALEVGVSILPGTVTGVEQTAGGVHAAGLDARYLVGADGLHSAVRRALGLAARPSGVRRFGVRQHFRVAPWSDMVEVHWLPGQEVYVTPVSRDTVGVALLGPSPLDLQSAIARLPTLAGNLSGAAEVSSLRGAGPLRQSTTARVAGRVLLVGDAAGYVDALTGEGMRLGFAQAQAAVDAIVDNQPQRYEAAWRRITRSYRNLTNTLLWVGAHPRLRPMIVPTAAALPRTFTRIVDQVAG